MAAMGRILRCPWGMVGRLVLQPLAVSIGECLRLDVLGNRLYFHRVDCGDDGIAVDE